MRGLKQNLVKEGVKVKVTLRVPMAAALLSTAASAFAASIDQTKLDELTHAVEPRVIEWRQDIHQHPELSNREVRTAKLVADHLKRLGLEVRTGIAHNGVTAFLQGGLPRPTIALHADMDALPITEKMDVPFRSTVTSMYRGQTIGVMHACGHDVHTAVLMGVAQLMLKEGVFDMHPPKVVFALHVQAEMRVGEISMRAGPFMAASGSWRMEVLGKQSHGARPWCVGADRQRAADSGEPSGRYHAESGGVTVGAIHSGVRFNIVPDRAELIGTIRSFDPKQREAMLASMDGIVQNTATANGATATFRIEPGSNPVLVNDPDLTEKMAPTLMRMAGEGNMHLAPLITGAEDFAFFAQKVPSMYFRVGVTPADRDTATAPSNHSDYFYVDEKAVPIALRAMTQVAVDYLAGP